MYCSYRDNVSLMLGNFLINSKINTLYFNIAGFGRFFNPVNNFIYFFISQKIKALHTASLYDITAEGI